MLPHVVENVPCSLCTSGVVRKFFCRARGRLLHEAANPHSLCSRERIGGLVFAFCVDLHVNRRVFRFGRLTRLVCSRSPPLAVLSTAPQLFLSLRFCIFRFAPFCWAASLSCSPAPSLCICITSHLSAPLTPTCRPVHLPASVFIRRFRGVTGPTRSHPVLQQTVWQ